MSRVEHKVRLKVCPWCQGTQLRAVAVPRLEEADLWGNASAYRMLPETFMIECITCMASGPEADSTEEAVKRWNARI